MFKFEVNRQRGELVLHIKNGGVNFLSVIFLKNFKKHEIGVGNFAKITIFDFSGKIIRIMFLQDVIVINENLSEIEIKLEENESIKIQNELLELLDFLL